MKKLKKAVCLVLTVLMTWGLSLTATVQAAAPSASALVSKALAYFNAHSSISCNYSWTYDDGYYDYERTGIIQSSTGKNHNFYLDSSQSEEAWEEYQVGDRIFRKAFDQSRWNSYTAPEGYEDSIYTIIQHCLSHMKNPRITAEKAGTYTVQGKISDWPIYKKVVLVISKKDGSLISCKSFAKPFYGEYYDDGGTYEVNNEIMFYSNICYGTGSIGIPAVLQRMLK